MTAPDSSDALLLRSADRASDATAGHTGRCVTSAEGGDLLNKTDKRFAVASTPRFQSSCRCNCQFGFNGVLVGLNIFAFLLSAADVGGLSGCLLD